MKKSNDQFENYNKWKANPKNTVVLNVDQISEMLGGGKEVIGIAMSALIKAFENNKDIILVGERPAETIQEQNKTKKEPTLTILCGVPGSGKSTYAQEMLAKGEGEGIGIVAISNDKVRQILTGLPTEGAINEKLRNTYIKTTDGNELAADLSTAPLNQAKNALTQALLEEGYDVVQDAPHAKLFMRENAKAEYSDIAKVKSVYIKPDTIEKAIKHAKERKERPESEDTIKKVQDRINASIKETNETGKFDKVITNYYEQGGFQDTTKEFYKNNPTGS